MEALIDHPGQDVSSRLQYVVAKSYTRCWPLDKLAKINKQYLEVFRFTINKKEIPILSEKRQMNE